MKEHERYSFMNTKVCPFKSENGVNIIAEIMTRADTTRDTYTVTMDRCFK